MFGLGMWEILVILVVALIFIGPQKLPEIARSLGKGLREFRGAADQLRSSIEEPVQQVTKPLKDAILNPEASISVEEAKTSAENVKNSENNDAVVPEYHVPAENGDAEPSEDRTEPKAD